LVWNDIFFGQEEEKNMSKRSDCIRQFVIDKLKKDPRWALRALEIVSANQTDGEYQTEQTKLVNGIGFNGKDAKMLTSMAKFYVNRKKWAKDHNQDVKNVRLTPNQMVALHKMIFKYWKQIVNSSDQSRLNEMVVKQEILDMNKLTDTELPLNINKKWVFDETRIAFLERLKQGQLVLDL
jgi:hypothetical protein